jgi:hypothetical protein
MSTEGQDSKIKYIEFALKEDTHIPVFFQPWYLDIVCVRGHWDVVLYEEGDGRIAGFWIYFITRKYGQKGIIMPPLTPYSGIWIAPLTSTKKETQTKKTKNIIDHLVRQIPGGMALYTQSFTPEFTNALPFYWEQYTLTLRYTFIVNNLGNWTLNNVATNIRNKIQKASKTLTAAISEDRQTLYDLVADIMNAKNMKLSLTRDMFYALDDAVVKYRSRKIIAVTDQEGHIHAATYIIVDGDTAYMMLLGSDRKTRHNGAVPLAIYHSMIEVSGHVKKFDFEGSMLESLFDLFSGFGGDLVPFIRVFKTKNVFWDVLYRLKNQYDKGIR